MIAWFAGFVVMPVLAVALLLAFGRLVAGPSAADRVVALDLLSVIGIGIIATTAIATGSWELIDVAIVLGLIGFLGTVAIARYLERGA